MHERGLHIDAEQHAEPDQIDAELLGHRPNQRHDDERQLEEVEEKRQDEDDDIDDDQKTQLATGQVDQQLLDPDVPVDTIEGQAEHARADQDKHHERGQLGGRVHRLFEQLPRQPSASDRHDQRATRAHRATLGRRRDAEKDRAQHQEDQRQRRDQHEGDTLGEP